MSIKRFLSLTIIWLICGFLAISCVSFHPKADLVIHNGTIYTLDEKQPIVKMVAVSDGKIIFAGNKNSVNSWIGARTQILNLQGKTMTPGFIESHGHILYLGYAKMIAGSSKRLSNPLHYSLKLILGPDTSRIRPGLLDQLGH